MVELIFKRVDPDTGNLLYKGTDGNMYVSVEGEIHDMTDEGEPLTPMHNVKVKAGEPVYDPNDRFGNKLENNNESKMINIKTFESFQNEVSESSIKTSETYLLLNSSLGSDERSDTGAMLKHEFKSAVKGEFVGTHKHQVQFKTNDINVIKNKFPNYRFKKVNEAFDFEDWDNTDLAGPGWEMRCEELVDEFSVQVTNNIPNNFGEQITALDALLILFQNQIDEAKKRIGKLPR